MNACIAPHPGGTELTLRLLALGNLASGMRVLDVGCGRGDTTARLLRLGYDACGVDQNGANVPGVRRADAAHLPEDDGSFDAVLLECCLSVTRFPTETVAECVRVLRPGGFLLCSDLYARGAELVLPNAAGRFEQKRTIIARANACGLRVTDFEDHSDALSAYIGQAILDGQPRNLCFPDVDRRALRPARAGYYLMAAQRPACKNA